MIIRVGAEARADPARARGPQLAPLLPLFVALGGLDPVGLAVLGVGRCLLGLPRELSRIGGGIAVAGVLDEVALGLLEALRVAFAGLGQGTLRLRQILLLGHAAADRAGLGGRRLLLALHEVLAGVRRLRLGVLRRGRDALFGGHAPGLP